MADLVVVMHDGIVEQYGAPQDVRCAPKTKFVGAFLETKEGPRVALQSLDRPRIWPHRSVN